MVVLLASSSVFAAESILFEDESAPGITKNASDQNMDTDVTSVEGLLKDTIPKISKEPETEKEVNQSIAAVANNPLYKALQARLEQVNKQIQARNSDDLIAPIAFPDKVVKVGYLHPDIEVLRKKLDQYFTYDVVNNDPFYFDQQLSDALKKYQAKMGLQSDGVIGPQTLAMLNRGPEEERKQILINMKRLQSPEWSARPDLRIEVDIARYWLTAYENNKIAFEMPVVVGTNERQTNRFSTVMTGVRLNPGWTLPPTIKSEDYIPKLRTNPEWVSGQGVMIYSSWDDNAEPIDPTTIDWNFLSDNEIRAMRFYKLAGDNNPLGRFRFLMNNKYDIYLHDTNQKYLFNKDNRAYSSGCVRVYNPRKIVEFLLKDDPKWTSQRIDQVLEKGDTYNVRASRSIPVYFDYKTAWLDEQGDLVLGNDIYNLDNKVKYDNLIVSDNR